MVLDWTFHPDGKKRIVYTIVFRERRVRMFGVFKIEEDEDLEGDLVRITALYRLVPMNGNDSFEPMEYEVEYELRGATLQPEPCPNVFPESKASDRKW